MEIDLLINRKVISLVACAGSLTCSLVFSGQQDTQIDHSNHGSHALSQDTTIVTTSKFTIPDLEMVAETGDSVRIVSDLIDGKIVLLNTIYTTCTTVCPPMGANFASLQRILNEQFGNIELAEKFILLSISIDPRTDTPERLRAWKEKFHGQPGWTLLTGSQADVTTLLKAVGLFVTDFEDHTPISLLGDIEQDRWSRISGLTSPSVMAELIASQLN